MSKPERGSLTTLLAKKPLGQGAPTAVPMEQAESALLPTAAAEVPRVEADSDPSVHTPIHTSVRTDREPDVPGTKLLHRGRRRTLRVPWTFKLPFDLREELEAVAKFNDLNMTEIAVEAIERHLKHFPHPGTHPRHGEEAE